MKMLNEYLEVLMHSGMLMARPELKSILLNFVEPGEYDKSFNGQVTKTVGTFYLGPVLQLSFAFTKSTLKSNGVSKMKLIIDVFLFLLCRPMFS